MQLSKSQTGVFVCNRFIIEEYVDLELHVVTWASTARDSNRFKLKSIVKTFILLVNSCFMDCLG